MEQGVVVQHTCVAYNGELRDISISISLIVGHSYGMGTFEHFQLFFLSLSTGTAGV